ncbi:uncharacterized protein [Ptychodera flava]|uniref:uncharacterized protein n=1 Tax=Ptychodera flava TaxID=63121 RepID=UPI00396A6437
MGVAYAEYSGRRIVEPLFFPHWTQDRSNRGVRTFNETYDAGRLNELVKVSTFEEFHRACNSSVDILLVAPTKHISAEDYQPKRDFYSQAYNISIPPYHKIPSSFDERVDALRSTDSVKCLGILEPGYWKNWPVTPTVDRLKQVENYLILAPAIRNMADRAADKMCGGRPYLAFHWRNRTGEICKPDHPCKDVGLIAAINKTAAVAADDLKKYTAKNNLSCTYVAFPPFAKRMITILAHAKVPNVVTRENITTSEYPEIERFKEDNYMMALIEQQICIRSKIFIAAMFSSWSGLVVRAREAMGAPTEKLPDIITWRDDRVSLKR